MASFLLQYVLDNGESFVNQDQTPPTTQPTPASTNARRTKVALWLLIGPSALFVGTIILYVVTNLIFPDASAIKVIVNIILYLAGVVTILTWLPGIIIGIILLATRKN